MKRREPKQLVTDSVSEATTLDVAKARGEAARFKSLHKESLAREIELERQVEHLTAMRAPRPKTVRAVKRGKSRGVAVIVPANDWHVEETVYREGTNGKNEYNLAIAEARIKRFYQKAAELIEWQNALAPVVELWHPLLGDLLSGAIHEELLETNSLSPTEACVFLQDMICSGIDFLLKETRLPILCPCVVGNHGRTTPKKRIKTSCRNSYEWLLYTTLARHYSSNPRVSFMVGTGYHNIQEIAGRKVRFHHGDGLRYQGGVGGITIPVVKSIAQWDKAQSVDFDIFGHWHQFIWGYNKWVSCGCLIGYTEYSVEIKADYQAPTQTFIVVDRDYGVTCATPIFVTESNRRSREEK